MGLDRAQEAVAAFSSALQAAPDPATQGWCALGLADARAAVGDRGAALELLAQHHGHPDPEVALQARLRHAQLLAGDEDWSGALAALASARADGMGPGWDASLAEARATALAGLGDLAAARTEWAGLEARWPGDPEALLPAWLGLAGLSLLEGDRAAAEAAATQALAATRDPVYRDRAEQILTEARR